MTDEGSAAEGDARQGGPGASLWGGRFRDRLDPRVHAFTDSLPFDRRLVRHDVIASMAHGRALLEAGVLTADEAGEILGGLSAMLDELEEGGLQVEGPDEDVHSWLERELTGRIGPVAGKLHTGRSRNDQTGAALRLYLRERLRELVEEVLEVVGVWMGQAGGHRESWMPGYTHLQRAQPVSLGHHLMAHAWALLADGERLRSAHGEAGLSPLGAGALAGTSHPVDPARTARLLGLREPYPNSILAVADRDYVASAVFAVAVLMVHLSRWGEEVVLWTSSEFGFASLSDEVAQGSSLMPQKKNPEAAELVRGKAGRVVGDLAGLLTTLKGLPLAYDSDLQEDKEPLFDALDTAASSLQAAGVVAQGMEYDTGRLREALEEGSSTATDLADHLVRRGVPFREAHAQVGRAVLEAERRGCRLADLPLEELRRHAPAADREAYGCLDPEAAVRARSAVGGPAPGRVRQQIEAAEERAGVLRSWLQGVEPPPVYVAHREGRLLGDIP